MSSHTPIERQFALVHFWRLGSSQHDSTSLGKNVNFAMTPRIFYVYEKEENSSVLSFTGGV